MPLTDPGALARPTAIQQRWQDYELGALFSLDLTTWRDDGSDHSAGRPVMDPTVFDPRELDTDQWAQAAKAFGARYALLTATHETGFMLWASDLYPYGVSHVPWRNGKADIVGDFCASCRRVGIEPGLFIGLRFNVYWGVHQYAMADGDEARREAYRRVCQRQVEELCSRYGPLSETWMEGGLISPEDGGPDVQPIIEHLQPQAVFYHSPTRGDHRWVGNERGVADDPCWATMPGHGGRRAHDVPGDYRDLLGRGDPDASVWSPAMCDAPLRNHAWFWHPGDDHKVYSVDALLDMHDRSVGRNGVLILGLTPDRRGLIPNGDVERLREFGQALEARYGAPVGETAGAGPVLTLTFDRPQAIDAASFMEHIEDGERIRRYVLEAKVEADAWRELARGSSVGHRRIVRFETVEAAGLRLRITESVDDVRIRQLAAYMTRA